MWVPGDGWHDARPVANLPNNAGRLELCTALWGTLSISVQTADGIAYGSVKGQRSLMRTIQSAVYKQIAVRRQASIDAAERSAKTL